MSATAQIKVLFALVLFLISVIIGFVGLIIGREEGYSWKASLKQGGLGVFSAGTLSTALYAIVFGTP